MRSPAGAAGKSRPGGRRRRDVPVAAMQPGRGGREEAGRARRGAVGPPPPLWSPAGAAGKRRDQLRPERGDQLASMEPGRGGREEARYFRPGVSVIVQPLWSPAGAAGKSRPRWTCSRSTWRRYGARPGRPGRVVLGRCTVDDDEPLWSPAGAAGKSDRRDEPVPFGVVAAMEPGRGGREEAVSGAGCPGSWSRRYGARSGRPGRVAEPAPTMRYCCSPLWSPAGAARKS